MTISLAGRYSEFLYGSGQLYRSGLSSDTRTPIDLQYYRTDVDGVYVFHWTFNPLAISPSLHTQDWNLQLDTVQTFDSANLLEYTKSTAQVFEDGNVAMGYQIAVPARVEETTQTWYARVQTIVGGTPLAFSEILEWTIPPLLIDKFAVDLLTFTPDDNVYNKDILKVSASARNTNLYRTVYRNYGTQFDYFVLQFLQLKSDRNISASRDEALYDNFGTYFDFPPPSGMTNIQYRRILQRMILAALTGGTYSAVENAVMGFTGYPPTISKIRDTMSFYCVDSQSDIATSYLDDAGTPPVLLNSNAMANGVVIQILNPGAFTLDEEIITNLINKITPAHVKTYIEF